MKVHRIVILMSATILFSVAAAQAEDPVHIPDPALKAAIEGALGIPDPTPSDMLSLYAMMNALNRGITDLTGLEYAKNLAQVDLGGNQLEDISVLAGLTHLREVSLYWNQITDVSVLAGLTDLTYLDLSANQISDLTPLTGLTKLETLYFVQNKISDLTPLAGLANLDNLAVADNAISDISPLAALTRLSQLNANMNSIQDLSPLTGLTGLAQLSLQRNQIADVSPLTGLGNLTFLDLAFNEIADLAPLSGLTNLTALQLDENQISDVGPLSALTNLEGLSLEFNQIADVSPLSGLTALTDLSLFTNEISDISPLSELTNLQGLGLGYNQITDISSLSGLTNLTRLSLQANQISNISALAGLMNLEELDLQWNHISDIGVLSGLTRLRMLLLLWNQISDISPLSELTDLTVLDASQNQIVDIGALGGLANLQELTLWSCGLTDITPLAGLMDLERLNISNNQVTDISALTGMMTLRELDLKGDPLHPKACEIDIPVIRVNNPGVVIHYDGCIELLQTLATSATPGGAVVMPGEDVFTYLWGELVPVEAVADEGYEFTGWSGTAVDANVMLDPCTPHTSVFMGADYSLRANFAPQEEPWTTVYFNDFEEQVGPEWSHDFNDVTPIGERRFLGQFGSDTVTLTLADLPPHSNVRVTFDLFLIHTWDGNGTAAPPSEPWGPDLWSLAVEPDTVLTQTTFDNHRGLANALQSYPDEYPGAGFAPLTGAAEVDSFGFALQAEARDAVYHMPITFEHAGEELTLSFSASLVEPPAVTDLLSNESWGLDNVRVEVLVADVELTTSSTLGGAVIMPGEGVFTYPWGELVPVEAMAEEGYQFTHWSGTAVDANVMLDPCSPHTSVIMDANYTLVAHFEPQDEPWSTVYYNDFEDQVGPEWSQNLIDATPVGQRRFLGQFNNETVILALADLPAHTAVRVTFDLFLIHSWDGDGMPAPVGHPWYPGGMEGAGPDLWSLTFNGDTRLLETTFDTHSTPNWVSFHRQSYPFNYPGPGVLPRTGAAEFGTLGYVWDFGIDGIAKTDSVYHLSFTVEDSRASIYFAFAASGLQPINDESWGLGNVHVEILAVSNGTLTISSTAGGAVTGPGEGDFEFELGTAAAVQAVAEAGYHFTHWSGSAVEVGKVADPNAAATTVLIDGDYTLVANFVIDRHTLATASTTGGSVTDPGEGDFTYDHGASVPVQATAEAGYHFTHWSGSAVDAGKVANPDAAGTTVLIDGDCTLVANFAIDRHTLAMASTTGGSVTEPGEGDFTYDHGASVPVQATAEAGYHFTHWSGSAVEAGKVADPSAAVTAVLMDGGYTLLANFAIDQRMLTVSSTAGGSVTAPGEGDFTYDHGASVPVQATAEAGYHFTHWSGSAVDAGKVADPNAAATIVLMDGGYTLLANFAIDQRMLTVSSTAGGSVTTPGEGDFTYDHGASVPVQATAEAGYHFTHWSGSAVDAGKVADPNAVATTVLMDGGYTLLANFASESYTLTVSSSAGGAVTEPGEGAFAYARGAVVAVQATAEGYRHFTGWSGTAVEAGKVADPAAASTTVTMDADYTLVANFAVDQHVLVVTSGGGGWVSVVVQSDGSTIREASDCTLYLDHGTRVALRAMPNGGYEFQNFASWSGDYYNTSAYWEFTLEQDLYLTASFAPEPAR